MDAVILAAGRNQRLLAHVPEFHKPLIRLGENSLVRNAVRQARWADVERPVVVVSPSNAYAVSEELKDDPVDLVIQREPAGPGDALRLGLAWKPQRMSALVLVLLADNVMTNEDVLSVTSIRGIGVRHMHHDEAARFTWYDPDQRRWREKEPIPDRLPEVACWVGPFVGLRVLMEHVLRYVGPINGEYLIGPYLSELTDNAHQVPVSSHDIGTEESYLNYLREGQ